MFCKQDRVEAIQKCARCHTQNSKYLKMNIEQAMNFALERARMAEYSSNDIPVGAIVLDADGNLIATGHNQRESQKDPTAHAEIIAMRSASKTLGNWRLENCTLVVTLEPCAMCAGAILQARIKRVVFGTWDEKAGACGSRWDLLRDGRSLHKVEVVTEVLLDECAELLKNFFSRKR